MQMIFAEDAPHIMFTPYVRAVTEQVVAQATTPLECARAIYEFITGTVDYRFQPAYAQLDAIADSCLKSRRGGLRGICPYVYYHVPVRRDSRALAERSLRFARLRGSA